jgi:hypothetical protein
VRAAALVIAGAVGLAACGDEGGVLVEVSQSEQLVAEIDTLHLFVGTPDAEIGGFAGIGIPEDVIPLARPLAERHHTIRLVRDPEMSGDTPVRVAVVGKKGDEPQGLAVLDLPGIPDDVMLRYAAVLEPIGDLVTTASGCLLLPDGTVVAAEGDRDCDGVREEDGDCDDLDANVHPGAYDACEGASLGVDDDCNDVVDDGDLDQDGATCQRDCDDADEARTPGRVEDCEGGVDNDCDQQIDEGVPEICGDGSDNDCNPETPDTGVEEICGDGADNDCDTMIDEGRGGNDDVDQDGATCAEDCNDDVGTIHPGADELCNGADDDCDDAVDEEVNQDGDGALCVNDCDDGNPARFPGNPEICDVHDNDCVEGTHPAPLPCLSPALDPCVYGFRACNETLGLYDALCTPVPDGSPLPLELCQDFVCSADEQTGLTCGGQPSRDCTVMVMDDSVCDGASHPLVAPGDPVSCTWVLLGGQMQQGWTVGLVASGATDPQPMVGSCEASFVVEAVPPGLQPGQFAVALFLGGTYDHTEVFDIAPEQHALCALPSLVCTGSGG